MSDFLNKKAVSFITNFFFVVALSVGLLVGLSAYADAQGFDISAAVVNFIFGK